MILRRGGLPVVNLCSQSCDDVINTRRSFVGADHERPHLPMCGRRPAPVPGHARAAATNCGRRRSSRRNWFGGAAIVPVGPRPCVAAGRRDPHDTGRVPARLVRERLRQIGEQVDLRDRLGAVRHSGRDGAAKADFDVRLVLDARVQGALAVLLGCHERLLVLRDALIQDDAVDAFPVEWDVDLGPGAHANAGRADSVRPSDELHHLRERHP